MRDAHGKALDDIVHGLVECLDKVDRRGRGDFHVIFRPPVRRQWGQSAREGGRGAYVWVRPGV